MIAYKKNCKVCNLIKTDKKLLKRIYDSAYYIPHSKDTLAQIHRDCKQIDPTCFTYLGLLNHCKKHQAINAADYERKMIQQKALGVEQKLIEDRFAPVNAQDAVINEAMKKLDKGELKVTTDHLLRAARDKQDFIAKKADQQLQLAEMIAFYTSGEDLAKEDRMFDSRIIDIEPYDPATPIT